MNDKLPEPQNGRQGPNAQDPSRRRLLRAAASAAPLIATLPSGAVLANNSAFQCVVKTENASENLVAAPTSGGDYLNGTTPDQWYRVPAFRAQWAQPSPATGSVFLYRFTGSDETTGPWYEELTGVLFKQPDSPTPQYVKGAESSVLVLRLYKPSPNGTEPTGLVNCDRATPVPGGVPEDGCVFPYARRDAVGNKDGNMGMNGSCMCSINPSYPGCPGAGGP